MLVEELKKVFQGATKVDSIIKTVSSSDDRTHKVQVTTNLMKALTLAQEGIVELNQDQQADRLSKNFADL